MRGGAGAWAGSVSVGNRVLDSIFYRNPTGRPVWEMWGAGAPDAEGNMEKPWEVAQTPFLRAHYLPTIRSLSCPQRTRHLDHPQLTDKETEVQRGSTTA